VIEIRRANKLKKLSSMMDKIDVYVCCDVPVSGHVSESMNNWTTSDKVSKDILKTQVFEDADEADFNRRLVIPVSEESLSSGKGFTLTIMDKDQTSADDAKATAELPWPVPLVPFSGKIDCEPNGRLHVAYVLLSMDAMLKMPSKIDELAAQLKQAQADDEEDEAAKAELAERIAALEADDEEDEAAKAALQAELAAAQEAIDAAAADAAAEREAMEAEAAAAAEEMTAKIEALTLADAEDAGEDAAQEDLIATLKANNEQLAAMVNDLREKLAETEQQLERKKGKIAKLKEGSAEAQAEAMMAKVQAKMNRKEKKNKHKHKH